MTGKLALGTAQFGLDYGIANQGGRVSLEEGRTILAEAGRSGIDTLDTAIAYGESERVLGQIGVGGFRVVSKLPKMPDDERDVEGWVERQVTGSLSRLGIMKLYGLLLHYPAQLHEKNGRDLCLALRSAKEKGLVEKTGVSIYAPDELEELLASCDADLIQAPLNILDQRLISSGWLRRLQSMGVEVHVRSIFLQGLLLMPSVQRPVKFSAWKDLWLAWDAWLAETGMSGLEACVRFALNQPGVERVVTGVDSHAHLQQIMALPHGSLGAVPDFAAYCDERLITPSCWNQL